MGGKAREGSGWSCWAATTSRSQDRALLLDVRAAFLQHEEITEDVRKYPAEQGLAEDTAIEKGMQEKAAEFSERGAEIYAKA